MGFDVRLSKIFSDQQKEKKNKREDKRGTSWSSTHTRDQVI
jgi:hypothetical protein